jgi:hypothetical protein
MSRVLAETDTLGIGKVAVSGREHLVAIGAPEVPKQKGLVLYILRFEEELREPKSALSGIPEQSISSQELSLAEQLINGSTSDSICLLITTNTRLLSECSSTQKERANHSPSPSQSLRGRRS